MNRTVTALYETRAQADHAMETLKAAHLGDHVEIHDQSQDDQAGPLSWLSGLLGGHEDRHTYAEGLRRGHFLLAARVDDLNEIRVAALLDAARPLNLHNAEKTWRAEGWAPVSAPTPVVATPGATTFRPAAAAVIAQPDAGTVSLIGVSVRTYEMAE